MVMTAFPLAEKYRNPVMILGDGLIGQMMEPVEFPDHLKSEPTNKNDWATNGMATRDSERRNLVKSLHLDPTALNRHNLNLKAKYERMRSEEVRYEPYHTDADYQVLIVSYGTMSRVCRTAIDQMGQQGIDVGMIRPRSLYPFPEAAVADAAGKHGCKAVACIEMSMGQMVEDVQRAVQGRCPVRWYGQCGGDVPTPEDVNRFVTSLL
jgi:2-oxoglutarate ferredoxin oxidoreductase subunit alpha